jgi:uncharacterized phage protein gp47/JayE
MPWTTPNLRAVRETVRGEITTSLGRASFVGNSVLRVMADATAALTHLVLKYIDWLALQLLPDTAETEWLDRHGDIWLVNADGSLGRKVATLAAGTVTVTGTFGILVPIATLLSNGTITYETLTDITIGNAATPVAVRAVDPGIAGNHPAGDTLDFVTGIAGVDGSAVVVTLDGGTDAETDEELRARVLRRIRQPPQGGCAYDYEAWALSVPGVTRAWCTSEMGMGTVTVRFMMDDVRADNDGFPTAGDVGIVEAYLETVRPVAVKDMFVLAPIPQPIDVFIEGLSLDSESIRAGIEQNINAMLLELAAPGQTIFAAWKYSAIMNTAGVESFRLSVSADDVMPSPGHMAVLGDISFF